MPFIPSTGPTLPRRSVSVIFASGLAQGSDNPAVRRPDAHWVSNPVDAAPTSFHQPCKVDRPRVGTVVVLGEPTWRARLEAHR